MKALVTGASKGIGRALARELVASGHQVWGVARSAEVLKALAEEMGENFQYTVADLTTKEGVATILHELDSAGFFPKKVFLVAGAYSSDDATFSSQQHRQLMVDVNFTGPVMLYQALLQRETLPTHIIAISSIFALMPDPLNPAYAEAKTKLSEYFIGENDKHGIQTKVVYLGPVNTAINRYAKRKKGLLAIEPKQVAVFLRHLPKKTGTTHIYPFSAKVVYQIFRYLPQSVYVSVMNKVRR